jgi:hypothetical protein
VKELFCAICYILYEIYNFSFRVNYSDADWTEAFNFFRVVENDKFNEGHLTLWHLGRMVDIGTPFQVHIPGINPAV